MPNAEDILNQALSDTQFEELNINLISANVPGISDSSVIIVDYNTRSIVIPESIKYLGVEADDDVISLKFAISRYFNDIDLADFRVNINYLNANNEGDVYVADDVVVDGDVITFNWTVGRYALAFAGNVCFNVCLKKFDDVDPSVVAQELNTTIATLPVLKGLETSEAVVQKYADVLVKWEKDLFGIGNSFERQLSNTTSKLQDELKATANEYVASAKKDIIAQGEATSSTIDGRVEVSINKFINSNPSTIITSSEYNTLINSIK